MDRLAGRSPFTQTLVADLQERAQEVFDHPSQEELKAMMKAAGFGHVDVHNLSGGVVAVHAGIKC
jgi:ubiquinone/menaquinone biosynthesis C-methylase UbiE